MSKYKCYYSKNGFLDGSINKTKELPLTAGTDITIDINSRDNGVISVPKEFFQKQNVSWTNELIPYSTFIIIADSTANWSSANAIVFAGHIVKVVNEEDSLQLTVAGMLDYLAKRNPWGKYNAVETNANAAINMQSATVGGIYNQIMTHQASTTGMPANMHKPASVIGTLPNNVNGTTVKCSVKYQHGTTYQTLLEEVRDVTSLYGTEFRFRPQWTSSAMTSVKYNMIAGGDVASTAHINENVTLPIALHTDIVNKLSSIDTTSGVGDGYYNHIVGVSKLGDEDKGTGADLTSRYTPINAQEPRVLVDKFFNPHTEMTQTQLNTYMDSMLVTGKTSSYEGTLKVVGDISTWLSHLGKIVNFTSGDIQHPTHGNTYQLRIVSIRFNMSDDTLDVGLMSKAPRYPKLPYNGGSAYTNDEPTIDYGTPISPLPWDNAPDIGGSDLPVDDWDMPEEPKTPEYSVVSPILGRDTVRVYTSTPPTNSNIQGKYWGFETTQSSLGPDGMSLWADQADRRFYGTSWVSQITKHRYAVEQPKSIRSLIIYKTMQFNSFPTVQQGQGTREQCGVSGEGGIFSEITEDMIRQHMFVSESIPGVTVHAERLASTVFTMGVGNEKRLIVLMNQLELKNNEQTSYISSKNITFSIKVDPMTGDAVGDWSVIPDLFDRQDGYSNWAPVYSIEVYGDKYEKVLMSTPSSYYLSKQVYVGYTHPISGIIVEYWKDILQGRYATRDLTICYDSYTKQNKATVGPGRGFQSDDARDKVYVSQYSIVQYKNELWALSTQPGILYNPATRQFHSSLYKSKINNDGTPAGWIPISSAEPLSPGYPTLNLKNKEQSIIHALYGFKNTVFASSVQPPINVPIPENTYTPYMMVSKTGTTAARLMYCANEKQSPGYHDGNSLGVQSQSTNMSAIISWSDESSNFGYSFAARGFYNDFYNLTLPDTRKLSWSNTPVSEFYQWIQIPNTHHILPRYNTERAGERLPGKQAMSSGAVIMTDSFCILASAFAPLYYKDYTPTGFGYHQMGIYNPSPVGATWAWVK